MSAIRLKTHVSRLTAAGLATSMAAVGMVATASAAQATSASIAYACTADGLGTFALPVVLDTNAPARMSVGQSAQVTLTADAVLPGDTAKAAASRPATHFDGSWTATVGFGTVFTAPATVPQSIGRTDLRDQTVPTAVPFVATSAPFTFTAPSMPGAVDITARGITGSLQLYNGEVATGAPAAITCTAPNGRDPVIDTIAVVAGSTTSLSLDKTASAYGQDVTATAKVSTTSGAPDGDVSFAVDGVATSARVGKDGVATLVLPDAAAGTHRVSATFVPRDPSAYDGSTTAAQAWEVSKVRTKMRVPVTGKRVGVATKVGVKAKGAFDTVPTGTVRIKLTRVGTMKKWAKVRKFDDQGSATAGFGKLTKGRYKVVVTYRGDTNHDAKKKVKRFRVTRR